VACWSRRIDRHRPGRLQTIRRGVNHYETAAARAAICAARHRQRHVERRRQRGCRQPGVGKNLVAVCGLQFAGEERPVGCRDRPTVYEAAAAGGRSARQRQSRGDPEAAKSGPEKNSSALEAASQLDLDQATAELAQAEATVVIQGAALASATANLGYCKITARWTAWSSRAKWIWDRPSTPP